MDKKEKKAIEIVAKRYIKNTGRKFSKTMVDFDTAEILKILSSSKRGTNISYFFENNPDSDAQIKKIEDYINDVIRKEHTWKYVANSFYNEMEDWIESLFINNKNVAFFKPQIVKKLKTQDFYKRWLTSFPDLNGRFSEEFSSDILEGDRRISDAITHIKKKIRDDTFEGNDSYEGCYIVRAQDPSEHEKQAGWIYTDDAVKIKKETYTSSKAGTLRAITNLRYALSRGLIDELNISTDTLDSLQEIEEKLEESLKDK